MQERLDVMGAGSRIFGLARRFRPRPHGERDLRSLAGAELMGILAAKVRESLELIGLRPVRVARLPVASLQQRYDHETAYDDLLRDGNGRLDRSILNSPHYKALRFYEEHGLRELKRRYKELDFYRMHHHWNQIGFKRNLMTGETIPIRKSDEQIWRRFQSLVNTHKSIRKHGYATGKFETGIITVLEVPFEVTRRGLELGWSYEVWSGHHRAASLAVLGIREAPVLLLEDVRAGREAVS